MATQEEKELRALDAEAVLNNPAFIEAMSGMKETLIQQIELCPWNNDQYRDKLMLSLQLLKGLNDQLKRTIETGKIGAWVLAQPTPE